MNKSNIKKIAELTGLFWVYNKFDKLRNKINSDRLECSIGDILLKRDVPSNNQLLLTTRLMDVEAYLSFEDQTFPFQNTISRTAYGNNHREEEGNKQFEALINSYLKEGYHTDSYVTCDKDMRLLDGNHRMGLHIHEKIDRINVRRLHRLINFPYGSDWYYEVGLPTVFMEKIFLKFDEIQQWLIDSGNTFCVWIKNKNIDVDIIKDLNRLCSILKVTELQNGGGYFVQFSTTNPLYQVKKGALFSVRAEQIENILKSRVGNNVEIIVSKNCLEGKFLWQKAVKHELF